MELKKVPVLGNFRVGHTKEPFSLEMMNSSKHMTFLERGLNNTFASSRNTGFRVYNHALDKRLSWSAGIFRNADALRQILQISIILNWLLSTDLSLFRRNIHLPI